MSNIQNRSSKRFITFEIWDDSAFIYLNDRQRLFFFYLWTLQDLAGVTQLNSRIDSVYLGFNVDEPFIEDFLHVVNSASENSEKIIRIQDNKLWMPKFTRYQQTGQKRHRLSAGCSAHIKTVTLFKHHGIHDEAIRMDPDLFAEFTESKNPPTKTTDRVSVDYEYSHSNSHGKSNGGGESRGKGSGGGGGDSENESSAFSGKINPADFGKSFRR